MPQKNAIRSTPSYAVAVSQGCIEATGPDAGGMVRTRRYRVPRSEQDAYAAFYAALAADFGTRPARARAITTEGPMPCRPLLTENLGAGICYGYGDPAVIRCTPDPAAPLCYYLVVTSNDAPDSFPILRSADLEHWRHAGFVFPEGRKPRWAAHGADVSDYWAPEMHAFAGGYLLCYSARALDGSLAIGVARSAHPEGPFEALDAPLLGGGVIDPHIFVDADGSALLLWKRDSNGIWPSLLARMLHEEPWRAAELFDTEPDRRTAAFIGALWPWAKTLSPMERFFALHPLIEAVVDSFTAVRDRLARLGTDAAATLAAMHTPIYAQPLAADGLSLTGEVRILIVNDLDWEGHLIEGPWLTRQNGRYYLFYAGNDFSTDHYGIGVAVAAHPFGPYRKRREPLLRSTADWSGPGHPSVAPGPDGVPRLFFHAFLPGTGGYKAFRALLTARLDFDEHGVALLPDGG